MKKEVIKKKFRMRLRSKVLLPTLFIVALSFLLNGTLMAVESRNILIKAGMAQAQIAAISAATNVNPNYVKVHSNDTKGASEFLALSASLSNVASIDEFDSVFILVKNEYGKPVFAIDMANDYEIGEEADFDLEQIELAFNSNMVTNNYIEDYEGTKIISCYYPIKNPHGEVVGVLGADYNATEMQDNIDSMAKYNSIRILAFLTMTGITILFVIEMLLRNIKRVDKKLHEIVGNDGDLTQKVEIKSRDEIGSIGKNLNKLLNKLNELMYTLDEAVTTLTSSITNTAGGCSEIDESIKNVSTSMEEIIATMEVVGDTVKAIDSVFDTIIENSSSISEKSYAQSDLAKSILDKVETIYEKALADKEEAIDTASNIEQVVLQRIEDSKSVSNIETLTKVILDIASQTRLLSLNASIEAARAGEFGRGFSVVAMEIGKLAEESANSAKSIQEVSGQVITAVTGLTKETENLVAFSKDITHRGLTSLADLATDYKENISSINENLEEFSSLSKTLNDEIVGAKESIEIVVMSAEECENAVIETNKYMDEIVNISRNISKSAENNKTDVESLASHISKFKFEKREEED